jgi:outer membrane protein assembly factor BamD
MNFRLISIFIALSLLAGCSLLGGAKNTKKLVADGFTPKELYELAEDKVEGGLIEQAIDQYEMILTSYPNSKYAIQARLDIAYNLFKQKKYKRAIIVLDKFIEKYPDINPTPYAYYLRGLVAESKSNSILDDIITDSSQRDVESIKEAYSYYLILIEKYPESKYSGEARSKLSSLRNSLSKHEFYVALYYYNVEAYIASINRSKYIIENYPNSSSVPDGLHLMTLSYEKINADQLAIDAKNVLSSSYPNYTPGFSVKK